jgi:signal peptidase I
MPGRPAITVLSDRILVDGPSPPPPAPSRLQRILAATLGRVLGRRLVAVTVRGVSMTPTYYDGDRVLVRRGGELVAGQVVVVERPHAGAHWASLPLRSTAARALAGREWMIKRVVAVQGDPVPRKQVPALAGVLEDNVPPGKLVLLGDNPDVSYDSRRIGYFPAERVLGVVLRPLSR